ncbi:hypothetical protein N8I77_012546 [Diaporthe amygdali]|uniref:Ecp2 effector protein-like domain-containing protein n=1 Tax=Phomopsis amygdali TaxID=1214568 RepID=A0AAD9S5S8_PHOAM|nr:hypothetical protein N8I77_012546 [Diaporthe amygdali]
MCDPSTVVSLSDPRCRLGTASLVDDCHSLIKDLEDLDGGGFWGFSSESTIVVASHGTCSFSVTVENNVGLFNIGTKDVINLINIALPLRQDCNGKAMVAVSGATSCRYNYEDVETVWLLGGPSQICDGGSG